MSNDNRLWTVQVWLPHPPTARQAEMNQLQMHMLADMLVCSSYYPSDGWGQGSRWLLVGGHNEVAATALAAAASVDKRARRAWAAWAQCTLDDVPAAVRIDSYRRNPHA